MRARVQILLLCRSCNGRNGGGSGGGSRGGCGCGRVRGGGRGSCGSRDRRCVGRLGAMEGRRHGRGGGGVAVAVGGRACACGRFFHLRRARSEGAVGGQSSRAGRAGSRGRCGSCNSSAVSRAAQGRLRLRSGRRCHASVIALWQVPAV